MELQRNIEALEKEKKILREKIYEIENNMPKFSKEKTEKKMKLSKI